MSLRILIVEDEPLMARALTRYLANEGYEVHCAEEREEAEALLAYNPYALVITDLALSSWGLTGLEVLENIADQAIRPKVIVFSGNIVPELRSQLEGRYVDVFLQKPQPLKEVARVAARLLGHAS